MGKLSVVLDKYLHFLVILIALMCFLWPFCMFFIKGYLTISLMKSSSMVTICSFQALLGAGIGLFAELILVAILKKLKPNALLILSAVFFILWVFIQNPYVNSMMFGCSAVSLIVFIPFIKASLTSVKQHHLEGHP